VPAPPNPGGQYRRLMRTGIANWLTAQHVPGLDHVYRSKPPEITFTEYVTGGPAYRCQAYVRLPDDEETRYVLTGPTAPTGKLIHYVAELEIYHRVYELSELDWADAEDDYDRIYEAVKDCLRAGGRQLGRPDAVFSVGEFRQGITGSHGDYELLDGGTAQKTGTVRFEVTQTV
jgi:hypothetical protein